MRCGAAPQTLAAFRNTALTLMRKRSGKITEEIEHFQENTPAISSDSGKLKCPGKDLVTHVQVYG